MPSPFPGMDPYLEHPDFWPEVHSRLIVAIADFLVPQVRPKYRVAIEKRIYQITPSDGDTSLLVGVPDIAVNRQPTEPETQASQVAVAPAGYPLTVTLPMPEQVKQSYLEVRDLATGQVVTAIEVLSPVNKRSGEGRETYLKKRDRILGSLTHLVEIDLLRGWRPMPMQGGKLEANYRILVSREAHRPQADLYAFNLRDPIPEFSLPLRTGDTEPTVDLQALLNQVYDRSGYDYVLDYCQPPNPPLSELDHSWANDLLRHHSLLDY